MRLIGSLTEQKYVETLRASREWLFADDSDARLLDSLRATFGEVKTAYVLKHIPEQGADIYTILLNHESLARVEVDRCDRCEQPSVEVIDLKTFETSLSKVERIKLAIALELAKGDLGES